MARYPFLAFWLSATLLLLTTPAWAQESPLSPIDGFRDLKFGMTQEEVAALEVCSSAQDCMYELSEKNRYITLAYLPDDSISSSSQPTPQLAKITIDMGHFTEPWYQQLQRILGDSYQLTQDFSDAALQGFLEKHQPELPLGYENGQIVLKVVRRPFGNLVLKVIYQNPLLAQEFVKERE